ncbi:hypothetical protein PHMEG_00021140 [Phytophthora megakarya]|uniref:Uncharacterized protein n=1 Tax=Phytophthora megakarya TaxID=4795 RepID=A0A225VNH6_9STRA|nr:hypothetical protein PHMEG_00021140 [Phytophthora megakarya]
MLYPAGGRDTVCEHPILYTWMGSHIQVAFRTRSAVCGTVVTVAIESAALALVAPPINGSPTTWLDPTLLYAQLPHGYEGFVVSFDSSTKTAKNGGYDSDRCNCLSRPNYGEYGWVQWHERWGGLELWSMMLKA